ncbi:hypothetical protein VST7929_01723 [Vibrio stylophorae]|uniref:diguanylate cyclase n=1 Tax=Vibrio stylophorae TaxID=659351 RepID=A0ABN8DWU4_9VIBR|nr:GGDEF domain-containing protein [Vibrio stylophorae]CAH0533847.1 hypothetical protein VST7929_01723 [Vibrio stylophorae]
MPTAPFYEQLSTSLNRAYDMQTVCEIFCRSLAYKYNVNYVSILIRDEAGQLNELAKFDRAGIRYYSPARPTECAYEADEIAFYHDDDDPQHPNSGQVILPLTRHQQNFGYVMIDSNQLDGFCNHELAIISRIAALELEARQLFEDMIDHELTRKTTERMVAEQHHNQQILLEQMNALHELSDHLWKAKSVDELLYRSVFLGRELLQLDRIAIFLLNADKTEMQGTYGTDIDGNITDEHYFKGPLPDLWFQQSIKDNDFISIRDNTNLFHDGVKVGTGWNAFVALWHNDRQLGWIALDNLLTGTPVQPQLTQLLKLYSAMVSQHLRYKEAEEHQKSLNATLEQHIQERTCELEDSNRVLERLSNEDPLTRIANRRCFGKRFEQAWQQALTLQHSLSLLIFDIDHFKNYNDFYGHAAGDECLKKLSQKIDGVCQRRGVQLFRYGGEEFIILMPQHNRTEAKTFSDQLLHEVQRLNIAHYASPITSHLTLSGGIATLIPEPNFDRELMIKMADEALYNAKNNGRDQVLFYSPQKNPIKTERILLR